MIVIRLQRTGRENLPTYRIVVAEKRKPVKGKFLEILGHYLPAQDPSVLEVDGARAQEWIKKGAIPSNTVARLLKRSGVKDMEKYMDRYTKKRPKGEEPPAPEAPAAPAAAPVAAAAPEAAPAAPEAAVEGDKAQAAA